MPCVERLDGEGRDLVIHLSRAPSDADLRELVAIFYRYKIDMRQLARFGSGARRAWFRDPGTYWHRHVFGSADREA